METTNNLNITIVSLTLMDRLAVGDIFLFSTYGDKYVFLGRTSTGNYSYMRIDNKRKYSCRYKRCVYYMDVNGGLFIVNGKLFDDYQTALKCATVQ